MPPEGIYRVAYQVAETVSATWRSQHTDSAPVRVRFAPDPIAFLLPIGHQRATHSAYRTSLGKTYWVGRAQATPRRTGADGSHRSLRLPNDPPSPHLPLRSPRERTPPLPRAFIQPMLQCPHDRNRDAHRPTVQNASADRAAGACRASCRDGAERFVLRSSVRLNSARSSTRASRKPNGARRFPPPSVFDRLAKRFGFSNA